MCVYICVFIQVILFDCSPYFSCMSVCVCIVRVWMCVVPVFQICGCRMNNGLPPEAWYKPVQLGLTQRSEVIMSQSPASIYSIAPQDIPTHHACIRHEEDTAVCFYYGNCSHCDSTVSFCSLEQQRVSHSYQGSVHLHFSQFPLLRWEKNCRLRLFFINICWWQ